jgi:hypothetical protein
MAMVIAAFASGAVFAETDFKTMAKNTVTVDVGPTIVGAVIGMAGDLIGGGEGLSSSGFGIAAQYERQLFRQLSVAGRFAYLGGSIGIGNEYEDNSSKVKTQFGMDLSSFIILNC